MLIRKGFRFEAAHVLPHHTGKCSRLHGHSYRLEVTLSGELQTTGPATGMVADFDVVANAVRGVVLARLDHAYLNDLIENPTAEAIVRWIWAELSPALPALAELVLWETATACAVFRREDARA